MDATVHDSRASFTVMVTGSRTWSNATRVHQELIKLEEIAGAGARMFLFHGGACGADLQAAKVANDLRWKVMAMPVSAVAWATQGKAAGVLRNAEMLQVARPDVVIAFRSNGESRGTDDAIRRSVGWMQTNKHLRLVRVCRPSPTPVQDTWNE